MKIILHLASILYVSCFSIRTSHVTKARLVMKVENDAFARANRATRSAGADDRIVELRLPLGMDLVR